MEHKQIELKFADTDIILSLGASVEDIQSILKSRRFTKEDDPELDRTDFELLDDGVDIIVTGGVLTTVFLHLAPHYDRKDVFTGTTNFLGPAFFDSPSAELFEQILTQQGFIRLSHQYPHAVDMLNENVRLRYEYRRDQRTVSFDNGTRVRGK